LENEVKTTAARICRQREKKTKVKLKKNKVRAAGKVEEAATGRPKMVGTDKRKERRATPQRGGIWGLGRVPAVRTKAGNRAAKTKERN